MARNRDEKKTGLIIASATEVFGELGFRAARMAQVASRAGISSGTIYTYFADKEELFTAAVKAGWEGFLRRIGELASSPAPSGGRIEGLLEIGFQTLKAALPLLRGMLFESRQTAVLHESLDRLCGYIEEILALSGGPRLGEREARRSFMKITVLGILFSAALAEPARTDAEIQKLKKAVRLLLSGRQAARTALPGGRLS
jgi:AcrR family transcriptional regulator